MDATTIGVDLAKTVFEVAVADHRWHIVARHRFDRRRFDQFLSTQSRAHVVMEACGTAHYWARRAQALGHRVTLLPAQYVRPYVRRNKTDRSDAEALLEAVRSGRIVPVTVKTVAQQELVALHRLREAWKATRTARINALRGFLREQGILLPKGAERAVATIPTLVEDAEAAIPARLRTALMWLYNDVRAVEEQMDGVERELAAVAVTDPVVQRLLQIPGIGVITATALVATVGHIHAFRTARRFASWLGLTPREHSTGPRRHLGAITKQGDVYLRCLLTHGARAVLQAACRAQRAAKRVTALQHWAVSVAQRRGHNRATIALANKLARVVWAVWSRDVDFASGPVAA